MSIPTAIRVYRTLTPPFIMAVFVVGIHLLPGSDVDSSSWWSMFHIDKIFHVIAFVFLSLSLSIAFTKLRLYLDKVTILMIIILVSCTGFGTILEILQGELMVERTADFLDIVADCAGSALGFIVFRGLYGVFPGQIPTDLVISNSRIA